SPAEVEERQQLYGQNQIAEPTRVHPAKKWFGYTTHPMALLLWAAGLISFLIGQLTQGILIWAVILVNASFSFWREYRAEKAVVSLRQLLPTFSRVIREGVEVEIPINQIVPGDLLVLAEGDNIPADARLVEEYGLRTNNATLTGESVPARKVADASIRNGMTDLDRPNLVFAGTSVVSGTGRAVVFSTGMTTQFGRIANLTQTVADSPSMLQQNLERISRVVAIIALSLGGIVFLESITDIGMPHVDALLLSIGIIVAALPEGLTPAVTLSLAAAVQRLAGKGVLVKKLSKVETMGTVSVICTDKSGTLTQNQMTVRELWLSGQMLTVSGVGYDPTGRFHCGDRPLLPSRNSPESEPQMLTELLRGGLLCNNARLNPPSVGHAEWSALGDHTEAALKVAAAKWGLEETSENRTYPRIHELPFDAHRKRMSTIHRCEGGEAAYVKGAPREILALSTTITYGGQVVPLTPKLRNEVSAANDEFARRGLRVLGVARRILPPRSGAYSPEGVENDLTFLGLVGLMDPPRPEVAQAIKVLRQAGIRMYMITGDYGLTAESIARRVGMLTTNTPRIITGAEFEHMTEADFREVLQQEIVFARMAPEDKLRVVDLLQKQHEVVAVIGDGVNDTPALRKADIGIAMGKKGTDVAREAADIILTDDNFGSVTSAIEEGRAVFDNLRKFITYLFASNVPEIMPFLLTALFHIPLALTVIQILAIDMVTDLVPALALGMERPEPDVMLRPPLPRNQPLINQALLLRAYGWLGILETILCYLIFYLVYDQTSFQLWTKLLGNWMVLPARLPGSAGPNYLLASTAFLAGVVIAQIGNAYACRSEKGVVHRLGLFSNKYLVEGVLFDLVLLLSMLYIPPIAHAFHLVPLPLEIWLLLILFAPAVIGMEKIRKMIARVSIRMHARRRQGVLI
ncbi:MAG TPA: cation-transporting P-type ATPase, partial [Anaerolineaceae bacterium]